MADLVIRNGHVLDASIDQDGPADVLIREGVVEAVGAPGEIAGSGLDGVEELDAAGHVVMPGLVDIHVHFREPGMEEEETIVSGAAAAVAGGYTSVACMPNTDPPLDSEATVSFVLQEATRANLARVYPVGCISVGRHGRELAEMGQMADAGAVAFTDDGTAVPTAGLLRRAMSYAKMLGKPILEHCENLSLAGEGVMNEGYMSTILGLPGIPAAAEEVVVSRDIAIARLTGAHLHIQHVSTCRSVDMIRQAKREGVQVTTEVTPHHLVLTDEAIRGYDPVYKVSPPLRSEADVQACREGLRDGTIDAVASDHAPHLVEEKELEFAFAPCGILGLETSLGVLMTHLVHAGVMTLAELAPALSCTPAKVLDLPGGSLTVGAPGDVVVIDPGLEWTVTPATFHSRSRNCPFAGETLKGRAVATVVGGRVVYSA